MIVVECFTRFETLQLSEKHCINLVPQLIDKFVSEPELVLEFCFPREKINVTDPPTNQ